MTTAISALPQAALGHTGELVPTLGLGTAPGGMGLPDEEAIALFDLAIDLGVTYIDTAPGYQRAQRQLSHVIPQRRDELFLVTKAPEETAAGLLDSLQQSLEALQADHVDLIYIHSLGHRDVDRILAPDGALRGLLQAKERGLARFIGFTAHHMPWKSVRLLEEAGNELDATMLALNFADRHVYNFQQEVVPLAREKGLGVAAMKVYGGGRDMKYEEPSPSALAIHGYHDHQTALRYALGLEGVDLAVVGVYNEAELRQNIDWVQNYQPLSEEERTALEETGRPIAEKWGEHFGALR
ncbi:MAG: hypothetical protein GKR89_15030 [Candidatus Latescibacteria bacterium]|nr:hypothetical protein [Candidatus Latescibacterota bacterium]